MGLFDNKKKHYCDNCQEIIEILTSEIERLWELVDEQILIILNLSKPPHSVKLIYNFNNKNQKIMADVTLVLGGPNETGTPSLIDNVTQQPVTGVTYSNMTALVQDQTIATVLIDPTSGIATATAVKVGVTTVVISGNAAFTDSNGNPANGSVQTVSMTITVTTAADGVTLQYIWS